MSADAETLAALLAAMTEVIGLLDDARDMLGELPGSAAAYAERDASRRVASTAVLKNVEQLEDLIARTLRAALAVEQVDLTGLSPRAIADVAEKLGLLTSSDQWSDLVKLRNRLVHEYPLPPEQQLGRLTEAWHAADELIAVSRNVTAYLQRPGVGR